MKIESVQQNSRDKLADCLVSFILVFTGKTSASFVLFFKSSRYNLHTLLKTHPVFTKSVDMDSSHFNFSQTVQKINKNLIIYVYRC